MDKTNAASTLTDTTSTPTEHLSSEAASTSTTENLLLPNATDKERKRDEDDDPSPWLLFTKVLVGPKQKGFLVHTHILRKVNFFRGCLDAGMIEAQEQAIRLPEDDVDAFAQLVHWLYHDRLELDLIAEAKVQVDTNPPGSDCSQSFSTNFSLLLSSHLLAKNLCCEDLENFTMDIATGLLRCIYPGPDQFEFVCENLQPGDGMHQAFSERLAREINLVGWDKFKASDDNYSAFAQTSVKAMEFALEALTRNPQSYARSAGNKKCKFHTHIDTKKC